MTRTASLALARLITLLALAVLLAAAAGAQDEKAEPDPRLDAPVTVEAGFTKLEDILADISKQTGITLKAGGSDREWRVAERKLSIYAEQVPVGKLLDDICQLLRYRMSRGKTGGQFTYLIWQDKNSRDYEAEMQLASREKAAENARDIKEQALDSLENALATPKEEALSHAADNPLLAYLGGTESGRAFSELMSGLRSANPDAMELMMRGRNCTMPLAGLPENLQAAARKSLTGGMAAEQISKLPADQLAAMIPTEVSYRQISGPSESASSAGFGGLLMVMVKVPGEESKVAGFSNGSVPLGVYALAPEKSIVGRVLGRMMLMVSEGKSMLEAQQSLMSDLSSPDALAEAFGHESPTEKAPPTDPALTREIDLKDLPKMAMDASMLDIKKQVELDAVKALGKATGMPVVSEAFTSAMHVTALMSPGKQPLYKALIRLEKGGSVWDLSHGILSVRPDNWALLRSYEIPESVMQKCIDLTEQEGGPGLDGLAWIAASLTDEQIVNSLAVNMKVAMAVGASLMNPMGNTRETLRLYHSLDPSQKAALVTEAGLPFGRMSADQWDRLSGLVSEHLGGVYVLDGSIRLKEPTKEEAAKMNGMYVSSFIVTAAVDGREDPATFSETIMILGKEQMKQAQEAAKKMMGGDKKPGETPEGTPPLDEKK